ncbi:M14 family zinc carboxypeptidase [Aquipuribacter nitratireducens]|uniref:M14 family zinc carboxypeptidase n=1 Tax=Aquipuribacter nitratireducens TaxID=650104 RepID=A0ABW0GHA3_9MICO
MRTRVVAACATGLLTAGVLSGIAAQPASAEPAHTPGGPCLQEDQTVTLSSVADYEDVERRLATIEANSDGRVSVESAGLSGEGRELYYATVGTGDTVFWLQARIHGNELQSTQAVLHILQELGRSNTPEARSIRENLTVVVIPMYNPDGAEANIRQSTTPTRTDLNRDWENFVQPESVAFWELFAEVQPDLGLDLHHMSSAPRVAGTDDLNQFQIGARTVDPARLTDEQWATARQMAEVSLDALDGYGQTHVARYPDIDITNAALSRMLLGGTAPAGETPLSQDVVQGAIFYEVRSVGQKSNGYLATLFERPTMAVLAAAADGSLFTSDWADYDALPYADRGSCGV